METVSTCIYCGTGCLLEYYVENNKIVKIRGHKNDEISRGKPCIKGLTINEVIKKNRVKKPLIRYDKDSEFKEVSWKEAFYFIYNNMKELAEYEIFFSGSGKITNEDNYVIQKFARICLNTNNVDACCSRLCHIATIMGLKDCYGITVPPYNMNDVYGCDVLLIIGSNPFSNYPVYFTKILEAKKKGLKIIAVNSVFNQTSRYADEVLTIRSGSETAFLNILMNEIIRSNAYDKSVENLEGFKKFKEVVNRYDFSLFHKFCCPEFCFKEEKKCRNCTEKFNRILELIKDSKSFGAIHGMSLTQHLNATGNVHSLLNLLILKNGKLLSSRGEISVQGVGDMCCSPNSLPTGDFSTISKLESLWENEIPITKGKNLIEAFVLSPTKAAFIHSMNIALSLPALKTVHKNLKSTFLVCADSHFNFTMKFANVVLPTPMLMEREGTITNGEGRVRYVRKVRNGYGIEPWKIYVGISKFFKKEDRFNYRNAHDIFCEIVKVIPSYSHIGPKKVYSGEDAFVSKAIKYKKFIPEEFKGVESMISGKYPFVLTTFRQPHHFLHGDITKNSKTLCKLDLFKDAVLINGEDAKKLNLKNGDGVRIYNEIGEIYANIKIDKMMPRHMLGVLIHYESMVVNKLFPARFDELSYTPNYKTVSVNIERTSDSFS